MEALECDTLSLMHQISSWSYVSETNSDFAPKYFCADNWKRTEKPVLRGEHFLQTTTLSLTCWAWFSREMYKIPLREVIWDKMHNYAGY